MVLNKKDVKNLEGIIVPLSTPFKKNEEIDDFAVRKQIDYLTSKGIKAIFPVSGTGEAEYLSDRETLSLTDTIISELANNKKEDVYVLPGVVKTSTKVAIELSLSLMSYGADGIVLSPHKTKYSSIKEEQIIDYIRAIKQRMGNFPLFFYNQGDKLGLGSLKILAKEGLVVGVKDGTTDLEYLSELSQTGIKVFYGSDKEVLEAIRYGGCIGAVTGSSNVLAGGFVKLFGLIKNKKYNEARVLQDKINDVVLTLYKTNPSAQTGVKIGLEYLGLCKSLTRHPMQQARESDKESIYKELEANKYLL